MLKFSWNFKIYFTLPANLHKDKHTHTRTHTHMHILIHIQAHTVIHEHACYLGFLQPVRPHLKLYCYCSLHFTLY